MIYSIFITMLILCMFFAIIIPLGKWVQGKYNIFASNPFISIVIGFIIFFFLTMCAYLVPIIFTLGAPWFISIEIIKDLVIIVFLWINRKNINLKIGWLQLIAVILIGVIVINIPFLINHREAYSPGDVKNIWFNHAFSSDPRSIKTIYNSWYMFNSILIYIFRISVKSNVYWFQGIIISTLSISVLSSYVYAMKRFTNTWTKYLMLPLIVLGWFISTMSNGLFIVNAGIATLLLSLVLFGWELTTRPQLRTFALSAATGGSLLIFDSSTTWIFAFYTITVILIYIWWKKPKVLTLFVIHIIVIIFSATLLFNTFSPLISTLSLVGFLIFMAIMFIFRKRNTKYNIDAIIYKARKWFIPVTLIIFMFSSLLIWILAPGPRDPWYGFNPSKWQIMFTYKLHNSINYLLYIIYFIILAFGIFTTYKAWKTSNILSLEMFITIFGTLSTILFLSPLTAPAVKLMIGDNFIKYLPWITIAPIIIGMTLNLYRIKTA